MTNHLPHKTWATTPPRSGGITSCGRRGLPDGERPVPDSGREGFPGGRGERQRRAPGVLGVPDGDTTGNAAGDLDALAAVCPAVTALAPGGQFHTVTATSGTVTALPPPGSTAVHVHTPLARYG